MAASTVSGPEQQAASFSSPHEEALINLMRTSDSLHRAFQLRLKPFGLTAPQYNALRILRTAHPAGLTCSAIGHSMITEVPDTTRLLARLKAQKLLSQKRDTHDRRILWTHITEQGLATLKKLDGIVEQAPREFFALLSAAELQELTRLLKKARCCTGKPADESADKAALPTGKPPSPHLPRQRPALPHRPE
jgi:DNA-binding MarR family transcriptional regulator